MEKLKENGRDNRWGTVINGNVFYWAGKEMGKVKENEINKRWV